MAAFEQRLDSYFHITERGSTLRTELKAGLITFLTMFYILAANPSIISAAIGPEFFGQLVAVTALAAIIACLLMGLYARFPVVLAPSMGINSFIAFTVVIEMGYTYAQALLAVLIAGILFLGLSLTGVRTRILESIPIALKHSITVGIGLFIMVVGLYNAGIIVHGNGIALQLGDLASPGVLLAVFSIVVTLVLWIRGRWSAVLVGALSTVAIGLVGGHYLGWETEVNGSSLIPGVGTAAVEEIVAVPDFGLVGEVFNAMDGFSSVLVPSFIAVVISLVMVDMFDTTGTLLAVGDEAGILDDPRATGSIEKAMCADAAGTVAGSVMGATTVTSFIESNVGIAAGARTGLVPVVVALLFAVSLFLVPVLSVITAACIAGALILVGLLMAAFVKDIDWKRPENAVAAALTIFMMGLSGSVTDGIALGFLGYGLAMTVTGRYREMSRTVRVLSWVFLGYFLLNYWIIPRLR
jgi:AGZA family xanthine/uracil permease-like MFS transporter